MYLDRKPTGCTWHPDIDPSDGHLLNTINFDPASNNPFDVPLPWLAGDWESECWRTSTPSETFELKGWQIRRTRDLAFVAIDVPETGLANPADLEAAALASYRQLFALRGQLELPHLQRVWHWLYQLLEGDGEAQRYRSLCRGRARAVDEVEATLPPATGIESARPGLRIQALFGTQPITPVENPRQVSAYRYPREHGIRSPAFARAAITQLGGTRYLLLSGTASIVGHETRHVGDVRQQTRESIANVAAVMDTASADTSAQGLKGLAGVRGYVAAASNAGVVASELRALLPGVPVTLLHGRLCRPDLHVEVETLMRF